MSPACNRPQVGSATFLKGTQAWANDLAKAQPFGIVVYAMTGHTSLSNSQVRPN